MLVFDLKLVKSSDAKPPVSIYEYKKQETIDAKLAEWEHNGWFSDPVSCTISSILVPNPDDPANDIELPISDNSIVEIVGSICNPDEVVICDDTTKKTCILMSWLVGRITELRAMKKPSDEDLRVIGELLHTASRLYAFKERYVQNNYVYGNVHNIAKTLKWDDLAASVVRSRLGLAEDATRLRVLVALAEILGGDAITKRMKE